MICFPLIYVGDSTETKNEVEHRGQGDLLRQTLLLLLQLGHPDLLLG